MKQRELGKNRSRRGWGAVLHLACGIRGETDGAYTSYEGGYAAKSGEATLLGAGVLQEHRTRSCLQMCGDRGERSAVLENIPASRAVCRQQAPCDAALVGIRLPPAALFTYVLSLCPIARETAAQRLHNTSLTLVVSPRQIAAKRPALRNANALQNSGSPLSPLHRLFRGSRWRGSNLGLGANAR